MKLDGQLNQIAFDGKVRVNLKVGLELIANLLDQQQLLSRQAAEERKLGISLAWASHFNFGSRYHE